MINLFQLWNSLIFSWISWLDCLIPDTWCRSRYRPSEGSRANPHLNYSQCLKYTLAKIPVNISSGIVFCFLDGLSCAPSLSLPIPLGRPLSEEIHFPSTSFHSGRCTRVGSDNSPHLTFVSCSFKSKLALSHLLQS